MDTNIKIVGFANQSVNGINVNNEGFDIDYDGNMLNLSGFSGDKMYYAKLNNQQIMDLLQTRPSQIPLEQRILQYKQIEPSKSKTKQSKSSKSKSSKSTKRKTTKKHNSHKKSISKISSYKSPKMRSEIKPKTSSHHSKSRKSNTIY